MSILIWLYSIRIALGQQQSIYLECSTISDILLPNYTNSVLLPVVARYVPISPCPEDIVVVSDSLLQRYTCKWYLLLARPYACSLGLWNWRVLFRFVILLRIVSKVHAACQNTSAILQATALHTTIVCIEARVRTRFGTPNHAPLSVGTVRP